MHRPSDARAAVLPSTLQLPPGAFATVLDGLCARFPHVERARWESRFARGRVLDAAGAPLAPGAPYRAGLTVRYFREVDDEAAVAACETILHVDEHLVVADKPHFLAVAPTGRFVAETLLARLVARLGNPELVPLHRIDRATAGLVLFSANRATRGAYQALFRERRVAKRYAALARPLPELAFPLVRRSRLERGEPFFRMREVEGEPNAETRIDVESRDAGPGLWRYRLEPVTGRKHQLRVQMAALGAPVDGDPWYPVATARRPDDVERPLRLLAQAVAFADPLTGARRAFESGRAP